MANQASKTLASQPALLVHYGEIALKRGNRPLFENLLIRNIRTALGSDVRPDIRKLPGRLVIYLDDGADAKLLGGRLQRVFGVANVALAARTEPDIDDICQAALSAAGAGHFTSFAIRAHRGEKNFPLTSQDINVRVGEKIRLATGARVDLTNPEFVIGIELMNRHAFVFADRTEGPGGLPVGASGKVACLISGGIDSPVAAWRMMKRGCRPLFIHFHSAPFTSAESQDKAEEIVEHLMRCQPATSLVTVPFGEIQKKIVTSIIPAYRVVIYRRFMIRIACEIAKKYEAAALVTGEALAQVASQTLDNMAAIATVSSLPILRPLLGLDKQEIVADARRIGTFDLSIQPHDDCCSFLTPRHPVTRSTEARLDDVERALDIEALVKIGLEGQREVRIPGASHAK